MKVQVRVLAPAWFVVVRCGGSIQSKNILLGLSKLFSPASSVPGVSLACQCEVAFEIIDLDRHGEIGATDLRRALQLPGKEEWKGWKCGKFLEAE